MAAWLPVSRLPEALARPLYWIGLSTDQLLLYPTLAQLGGFEAWQKLLRVQARCVHAWESAAKWLQARSGAPTVSPTRVCSSFNRRIEQYVEGPPERETASLAHSRLDALLAGVDPDHPVLRMLRATLEVFRARGIPVFVYLVPLNLEYLERIGIRDPEGLRRGIEACAAWWKPLAAP